MKTQAETDNLILTEVKQQDNELEEVRIRHTNSVHPMDCQCPVCKPLEFAGSVNENKENELKEQLDYYDETKPFEEVIEQEN